MDQSGAAGPVKDEISLAFFVSSHGFGHAARSSAVMEQVYRCRPSVRFEIFTRVPSEFFRDSLSGPFRHHSLLTDIGLVQKSPVAVDLPSTLEALDKFLPFPDTCLQGLAARIREMGCRLILCDIAPLGIAVGREAGIASVLIENFTWDWIYEGYPEQGLRFQRHIRYLRDLFGCADYHVQAEPVCRPGSPDLRVAPISRKNRARAHEIRQALQVPGGDKLVLLTMGGIPYRYKALHVLAKQEGVFFVVFSNGKEKEARGNILLLPQLSGFYHPDLINASDAVIGKLGYSTLAEVYTAGVPFGYVSTPHFRESEILCNFVKDHMNGIRLSQQIFDSGDWVRFLDSLLSTPAARGDRQNGAKEVARFLCDLLTG